MNNVAKASETTQKKKRSPLEAALSKRRLGKEVAAAVASIPDPIPSISSTSQDGEAALSPEIPEEENVATPLNSVGSAGDLSGTPSTPQDQPERKSDRQSTSKGKKRKHSEVKPTGSDESLHHDVVDNEQNALSAIDLTMLSNEDETMTLEERKKARAEKKARKEAKAMKKAAKEAKRVEKENKKRRKEEKKATREEHES